MYKALRVHNKQLTVCPGAQSCERYRSRPSVPLHHSRIGNRAFSPFFFCQTIRQYHMLSRGVMRSHGRVVQRSPAVGVEPIGRAPVLALVQVSLHIPSATKGFAAGRAAMGAAVYMAVVLQGPGVFENLATFITTVSTHAVRSHRKHLATVRCKIKVELIRALTLGNTLGCSVCLVTDEMQFRQMNFLVAQRDFKLKCILFRWGKPTRDYSR